MIGSAAGSSAGAVERRYQTVERVDSGSVRNPVRPCLTEMQLERRDDRRGPAVIELVGLDIVAIGAEFGPKLDHPFPGVAHLQNRAVGDVGGRDPVTDAGAMKPVETGCAEDRGTLVPADAVALAEAAGTTGELALVAPYRYAAPVAPLVASRAEGRQVDPLEIMRVFLALTTRHSFVLVEGAGGLLVPVTEHYRMLDLVVEMDLPLLIVASSKLGVINHSLLTIEAASAR